MNIKKAVSSSLSHRKYQLEFISIVTKNSQKRPSTRKVILGRDNHLGSPFNGEDIVEVCVVRKTVIIPTAAPKP